MSCHAPNNNNVIDTIQLYLYLLFPFPQPYKNLLIPMSSIVYNIYNINNLFVYIYHTQIVPYLCLILCPNKRRGERRMR